MAKAIEKNGDIRPVNKRDISEKPQVGVASTPLRFFQEYLFGLPNECHQFFYS